MSEQDFDRLRRAMVSNQLRTNAVSDAAVLAAMEATPREAFVGAGQAAAAYSDMAVPLGEGRALNPPIATGRLLNAAQPRAGERALVIGSATGYVAALLTTLGCKVTALEESPDLAARAEAAGVVTVQGALFVGWAPDSPYDLIYIDGAVPAFPKAIVGQLADGGRIVGALLDRGVSRLAIGRGAGDGFGVRMFADVETAPLPGFAPEPAFAF
ncbi:MAG: protein-L-isoaspartate O-methyltransferase [Sphingomonas bacterium]|nr:protein-L-isoaspartate O-methyltransferase [Sphingomonas bacterium]